jgi:hypothetical protein
LLLNKTPGKSALSSNLVIGMGGQAGIVKLGNDNQLADATSVTINNGTLDLNGNKDAIRSLSGTTKAIISFDGPSGLGGTPGPKGQLTVRAGTFAGTLKGSGTLTKVGTDTLVLTKESKGFTTRTSFVNVNQGTLTVNGQLGANKNVTVNVPRGGKLDGKGHISGDVGVKGGKIKAGLIDPSPGILTIDGALSLTRGSTMAIEIAGVRPGNGPGNYSQFDVGGPVTLGGSDLAVTLDTAPDYLNAYTIIRELGTSPISPGFAQGDFVTADFDGTSYRFKIDYAAGPGHNNVDLIDVTQNSTPEPSTLVQALLAIFGVGAYLAVRSRRGEGRGRAMGRCGARPSSSAEADFPTVILIGHQDVWEGDR